MLREQPEVAILSVSQMDNYNFCNSSAERAINARESSEAGALLRAVNRIADALSADFPTVAVDTLAYQWSRAPPKLTRPRRNVIVRLCTIECDFSRPIGAIDAPADGANRAFARDLTGWARLSARLTIWDYTTNFDEYFVPFPNWRTIGANVRFYRQHGVAGVFAEGAYNGRGGDLSQLKDYLWQKALWDGHAGEADIHEFVSAFFGAAAAPLVGRYMAVMEAAAVANASFAMGEAFTVQAPFLTPPVLLAAARAMVDAERAARAAAEAQPTLYGRFVPRVVEAGLPIMHTVMRRWRELQTFDAAAVHTSEGAAATSWPYEPSLKSQFATFSTRFEAVGATRLNEQGQNLTWLAHELFDASPPPPSLPPLSGLPLPLSS